MPATNAQDLIIFRDKCAIIKDFPLYRIDIGGSLVDTFPESSPYRTLAINVQNFERFLSNSTSLELKRLRCLLGDPTVQTDDVTLTPKLVSTYSDQVSALLAAYRLLDLEVLRMGAKPTTSTPLHPNIITRSMVEVPTVSKQWKKVENWQKALTTFAKAVDHGFKKAQPIDFTSPLPFCGSLAHLQGLADSHADHELNCLVQNFRGAALHLSLIKDTAHLESTSLPGIPESLGALIEQSPLAINPTELPSTSSYQPHTRKKIDDYLKHYSRGELSLPLHMSLLMTPLFLILPVTHSRGKFPRQAIYQLSCALGNQRPEVLTRVEREIWNALWTINENSSLPVIRQTFEKLIQSDAFIEAVNMPPSDPVFSFFRPYGNGGAPPQVTLRVDADEESANTLSSSQLADLPRFQQLDSDVGMASMEDVQRTFNDLDAEGDTQTTTDVGTEKDENSAAKSADGGVRNDLNGEEGAGKGVGGKRIGADGEGAVARGSEKNAVAEQGPAPPVQDDDEDVGVEKPRSLGGGGGRAAYGEEVVPPGAGEKTVEGGNGYDSDLTEEDQSGDAEKQGEAAGKDRNAEVDNSDRLGKEDHQSDDNEEDSDMDIDMPRPRSSRKRTAENYAGLKTASKRRKKDSSAAAVNKEGKVVAEEEKRWIKKEENVCIRAPLCNLETSGKGRPKLGLGRTVKAWGPEGHSLEFEPMGHASARSHHSAALQNLQSLITRIEESYEHGQPLYVKQAMPNDGQAATPRKESVFKILTEQEFCALEDSAVQEILRRQHIVVAGIRHQKQSFKDALRGLSPLDWITSIHDQSFAAHGAGRVRTGSLADLLEASKSLDSRILNALDIPDPFSGQEGWAKKAIPIEDIRWGLAATTGAFHHWHVDSDGFGTFIDLIAGSKWWIVARPIGDLKHDWSTGTSWLKNKAFDLDRDGKGMFDVEAILLQPGSRLIMRPNTLHAVYTPEHAVCRGGHFYATSTMQDTFMGLVHTFICDKFLTNTSHLPSRFILGQMINFYHTALVKRNWHAEDPAHPHIPALNTLESFKDLLLVCGLGVLINVLSFQTYTAPGLEPEEALNETQSRLWNMHDINGLSEDDRKLCCLTRGQSFELIAWLDSRFTSGFPNMPIRSIFTNMLFNICQMLCDYKWRADEEGMHCMPGLTLENIQVQITCLLMLALERDPAQASIPGLGADARKWKFPICDNKAQSILPSILDNVCFQKSGRSPYYKRLTQEELFGLGETVRDKAFAARLEVKREIIDD